MRAQSDHGREADGVPCCWNHLLCNGARNRGVNCKTESICEYGEEEGWRGRKGQGWRAKRGGLAARAAPVLLSMSTAPRLTEPAMSEYVFKTATREPSVAATVQRKRPARAPVALDGSIVTTKSAPAAHSLADAATEPPAACSLARASALLKRSA